MPCTVWARTIIKKTCHEVLLTLKISDPLLDIALELEERVGGLVCAR